MKYKGSRRKAFPKLGKYEQSRQDITRVINADENLKEEKNNGK